MVTVLSPLRIARSRRTSFQAVEETQELDFQLGRRQAIRVYAVEFGYRQVIFIPSANDAIQFAQAHLSLHIETGGLEGAIDAFPADETILNSEIMAETTLQVAGFTSSVPSTSPDFDSIVHLQPLNWNFIALTGGPILVAQNLTFRGIGSAATLTINGAQATVFYDYVELTLQELGQQFALRR